MRWLGLVARYLHELNKDGELVLTGEGKEIIDEAMFLATNPEAHGPPGFRGIAG